MRATLKVFTFFLWLITEISFPSYASQKIKIVCTFTILADMVRNVGGDQVEVTSLVGSNCDPHVFTPTPKSAELLAQADLVFINGHGFEGWMNRLVEASGYKGKIIMTTEGMTFILAVFDEERNTKTTDPHTWLTIEQALVYIKNIKDALSEHQPKLKTEFEKNYEIYKIRLEKLDIEIREKIKRVSEDKRKVITAHDAFSYFGQEYGIKFSSAQGITTESEASAKNIAALIDQIKAQKIKAVFVENIANERLIREIADQTGVSIQGILYTDALSEVSEPASSYIDLMRHNVTVLVEAMQKNG